MRIKPSFPRRRESSKTMSPRSGQCQGVTSPREDYPIDWIPACAGMTKQRGISLVELVMFIVIISVAVVGILQVMNLVTAHSADPLIRKQALAIAESLLEEIEPQDFTKPAGCFAGPFTPANRGSFDCVTNYNGFATTADNVTGLPSLGNYSVAVEVVNSALGSITAASANAVRITVTVTDPTGHTIDATGYRTNY